MSSQVSQADPHSGLIVNLARSSKSNLSISLVAHLVNIEILFFLITKIPAAVMMPYIVQVCHRTYRQKRRY